MKKCSKCGIEKPLTEFHKNKRKKDGHRSECKSCTKQYTAEYLARPEIKERRKQQTAEYRAQNKERRKQYNAEYRTRPEVKERNAEYYAQNKERRKQQAAEYQARPEIKERRKQQQAEYYARPEIKERRKQRAAEWYAQNKERIKQQKAEYDARPEVKEKKAEYHAQKNTEQPACIYQIKNVLSNKIYIGETTRGELRWKSHLWGLRANRHSNYNLQQDFNEHGEEVLEWSIIKELPKDKDTLLLEEAREIERRIDRGEDLYNLMLTIEQIKMLKENA